jgi:hypothetical protein
MAGVQFEIIGKNWQLFIKKHWKARTPMAFGAGGARK